MNASPNVETESKTDPSATVPNVDPGKGAKEITEVESAAPAAVAILERGSATITERAEALVVDSQESLEACSILIADVKAFRAEIATDLGEPTSIAYALYKKLRGVFTKHDEPLKALESNLKARAATYVREEEARQRQIAADAAAEASKKEDERKLAEASALEEAGDTEGAAAVISEPTEHAPITQTTAPKASGLSVSKAWKAEILSITDLAAAALADPPNGVALSILKDEAVLKAATSAASRTARGMKANFSCPGARAISEDRVSSRKA